MNAFHRETELEISSHWQSVHAIEVQQGRRKVGKYRGLLVIWSFIEIVF